MAPPPPQPPQLRKKHFFAGKISQENFDMLIPPVKVGASMIQEMVVIVNEDKIHFGRYSCSVYKCLGEDNEGQKVFEKQAENAIKMMIPDSILRQVL